MSTKNRRVVYFANLDAIRFVAFLMVFLTHLFYTENENILNSNWYQDLSNLTRLGDGVMVFYTLSGFLITYLLLAEEQSTTKIHIGKFYLRRILRIWPLYYLMVTYGFVGVPVIKHLLGLSHSESAQVWYYLLLLPNYSAIYDGAADATNLNVLWSIGIEEQFYLLWPVLLVVFRTNRWLVISLVAIFSAVFRVYYLNAGNGVFAWQHTAGNMFFMALGALGALYAFSLPEKLRLLLSKSRRINIIIYLIGIGVYFYLLNDTSRIGFNIKAFWVSLLALYIILEQEYSETSFYKFKNYKSLLFLGGISYGLYCYHTILITIIDIAFIKVFNIDSWVTVLVVTPGLSFILTVLVSYFSYKWFEGPILRYKDRFAYIRKQA